MKITVHFTDSNLYSYEDKLMISSPKTYFGLSPDGAAPMAFIAFVRGTDGLLNGGYI